MFVKRLSRDKQKRRAEIHDYLLSIGGQGLRQEYQWTYRHRPSAMVRTVAGSRGLKVEPLSKYRADEGDHLCCFGKKLEVYSWVKNRDLYCKTHHITLTKCSPKCWTKAVVLCVRETNKGNYYLHTHLAGQCPICDYTSRGELI